MSSIKGNLTSGTNPLTDMPNRVSAQPTWSFHERYASDAEFKRQIDDARNRRMQEQATKTLTNSLNMTRDRKKLY